MLLMRDLLGAFVGMRDHFSSKNNTPSSFLACLRSVLFFYRRRFHKKCQASTS